MGEISKPFNGKNYWKKKGYNLLDGATQTRRKIHVVKINGEANNSTKSFRRIWRIKKSLKFKSLKKVVIFSPKKLWNKFKNGYINMMLRLAGDFGPVNGGSEFGQKRISQARQVRIKYKNQDEFEARLVLEIYKALSTSKGLSEIA